MRRVLLATLALVVAVAAYGSLDVLDLVPGILTRQPEPAPSAPGAPTATSAGATPKATVPTVEAGAQPLQPASASAPIPDATALAATMAPALHDPALGSLPGVVVRDAFTGQGLLQQAPD